MVMNQFCGGVDGDRELLGLMDEMGFAVGCVYEVIVSSFGEGGEPHAAPMGTKFRDSGEMILRPFKETRTYFNLSSRRCGVVNVVSDPEFFYKTAFKEVNPDGRVPSEWFEPSETIEAPRLKGANPHLEFLVVRVEDEGMDRANMVCKVERMHGRRVLPSPYCRATFATIECIIHATRVKEYLKQGRLDEVEDLIRLVKYYGDLVYRVAPTSEDAGIIDDLTSTIDSWR